MLNKSIQSVCLHLVAATALVCQAAEKQDVLLYNTSTATAEVLAQAQKEAHRIFQAAGIELNWMNCSAQSGTCQEQLGKVPLLIQVVPSAGGFPSSRMLAWAGVGEGGYRALVFMDRIESLLAFVPAENRPCDIAQLLGHVMAHEMGHLLLALQGHARVGLMTGPWGKRDLVLASEGGLLFTPDQAARMRAEVRKREAEVRVTASAGYNQNS